MSFSSTASQIWHFATSGGVPKRSLILAIIVGSALNLINQGEAVFGTAHVNWFKLVLTYIVPYLVSTYGAVSVQMRMQKMARPKNSGTH